MAKIKSIVFERHDEEVEEIIGIIPKWIIRWGISLLFFLLMCLIVLTSYVKFPETVEASVNILAKFQPYKLEWLNDQIRSKHILKVKERQVVKAGDTLLIEDDSLKHTIRVFRSPFSGTVFQNNLNLSYKTNNFIWVLKDSSDYNVILKIHPQSIGKVKVGQKVLIDLDEYPKSEFGYLEGILIEVMPIKSDGLYLGYVLLKNGLVTHTGYFVPNIPTLSGKAMIITDDKSVLQRVFYTIAK